ncbi:hypothetical protein ACIQ9M_34695 [Streptomyces californicus]|uniref:hypothetical protein n=1 Tax=Streptomyces californicus TaxID=67351 RepID=UPI003692F46A
MFRRTVPLVVIAALAVSCSESPQEGSDLKLPDPTRQVLDMRFPLDKYELSNGEMHLIYEASDILIRTCMEKSGHEWPSIEFPKKVGDWRSRLHFGLIETEVARLFGYSAANEMASPPEVRQVVRKMKNRFAKLGQGEIRQAEACKESADLELTRNATAPFARFNDLKEETFNAARRDPGVLGAEKAWIFCMRKAGFKYAKSGEPGSDPRWAERPAGKASPDEIATAEADVKCKQDANLITLQFDAEVSLEKKAIQENLKYLNQIASANVRYLENARNVISQG